MKKLRVLGCGDAFSSGGRFNTSFLIEDESSALLMDCGATTLLQLQRIQYPTEKITTVVLSHFHGDHFGGLPFLVLNAAVNGHMPKSFTIIGPVGVEDKVRQLQESMYPETSRFIDAIPIAFKEHGENWLSHEDLEIRSFPVDHSPPSKPHGLQLKWNNQILGFSGDTEWTQQLVALSAGTEVFILECNNLEKETPGHLSLNTIREKSSVLKAKKIFLTHMAEEMLASQDVPFEKLSDNLEVPLW